MSRPSSEAGSGPDPGGVRDRTPRSRYLALLGLLLALVLAVSFATNWWLYRSVEEQMDGQMGERLLAIGTTVAGSIGWDGLLELSLAGGEGARYEEIRRELRRVAAQNDLDGLSLVDAERRRVVGLDETPSRGAPDPALSLRDELVGVLASGRPRTTRLERVEVRGLPPQYLKTGVAPILDPDGVVVGAVVVEGGSGFFSVLPELRRRLLTSAGLGFLATLALGALFFFTLRSLIRLEESLRGTAALAAIGQISSVVAHEIKNPLAIIRSRSERVRAKIAAGKSPEEILEWFDVIPAEVDRLNEIVTNYLSLARPERAGEGRCRVDEVVCETIQLLSHDLEKRGVRISAEVETTLTAAIGARSLKQVLLNLVLNAAQAIDGKGEVRLLGRPRSSGWVEIAVRDTGHGMSPEEQRRVLEPFFTTKATGSGLGLTLVQSLVLARGGRLEIESRPGEGTAVRILLPAG